MEIQPMIKKIKKEPARLNLSGLTIRTLSTEVGELNVGVCRGEIWLCEWENAVSNRNDVLRRIEKNLPVQDSCSNSDESLLNLAQTRLRSYLAGGIRRLDMPVHPVGTEFQLMVWKEIQMIPYGETISYSELSKRIGRPGSVRAVASACRANALSLFIPCHRVIASSGKLHGYAGGPDAKAKLLELEARSGIF